MDEPVKEVVAKMVCIQSCFNIDSIVFFSHLISTLLFILFIYYVKWQDSLSEQAAKGEITLSGRKDLLTTALGTKEHAGRVRGAGIGVTITEYFGRDNLKCSSQITERLNAMEQQVIALKRMVTELQSTKGLPSTKDLQTTNDVQTTVPWEAVSTIARSYLEFPEVNN